MNSLSFSSIIDQLGCQGCPLHDVKMSTTEEDLHKCEAQNAMRGLFLGCIGSYDVGHVAWDRCRASLSISAPGKEGFPTSTTTQTPSSATAHMAVKGAGGE